MVVVVVMAVGWRVGAKDLGLSRNWLSCDGGGVAKKSKDHAKR